MKLIDFLIIIGMVVVVFFGYQKYFQQQKIVEDLKDIVMEKEKKEEDSNNQKENEEEKIEEKEINEIENSNNEVVVSEKNYEKKGFYKNEEYYYEISFPEDWPLKITSNENISIGTFFPKNGYGAITIEISKNGENELAEAKKEAEKYSSFIKISEEDVFLSGIKGNKLTLSNTINNITNVYIILEKNNIYYALKYSEESENFILQVEKILNSFKFTR